MIPKFRAWHKEYKQMRDIQELRLDHWPEPNVLACVGNKDIPHRFDIVWGFSEIELMQWTGFKDMHSEDIFEGDVFFHRIFNQEKPQHYAVIWKDGAFRIKDTKFDLYSFLRDTGSDTKVIGNIYANPEFLNAKTN